MFLFVVNSVTANAGAGLRWITVRKPESNERKAARNVRKAAFYPQAKWNRMRWGSKVR